MSEAPFSSGLTLADLPALDAYERIRPDYRARVIAHKSVRRVAVGDRVSLVFEDRETVRYQILEMARIERIREPERLAQEIQAYGELLPAPGVLSATLFIEIPELASIRAELDRLLGIDECVFLVLGGEPDEDRIRARFDPHQLEEERISAVHYVRFPLSPEQIERFASPAERARLRIDHPAYRHEGPLAPATRESLLQDLRGECAVLLDDADLIAAPVEEVLEERHGLRLLRPAVAVAPGHLILETSESGDLTSVDPQLLERSLARLRQVAEELKRAHGGCRIWTDVASEAVGPLRFHLVPRGPSRARAPGRADGPSP